MFQEGAVIKLRTFISIISLVVLMACEGSEQNAPVASSMEIQAAVYVSPLPSSITLLTMVNEDGDFGEHSGILINASQKFCMIRQAHFGIRPARTRGM